MKKVLALILAMGMAMSFGACGEEVTEGVENAKEATVEVADPAKTSENSEKPEKAEPEMNAETAEKPEKKEAEPAKDEKPAGKKEEKAPEKEEKKDENPEEKTLGIIDTLTLGDNDGSMYVNAYVGVGFRLPEGWTFFPAEKMNEINGFTSMPEGEALEKAVGRPNGVYAMAAQGDTGSVNMMMIKLPDEARSMTEDQYLKNSLAKTKEEFEKKGATEIEIEHRVCSLNGKKLPAAQIGYTANGQRINQTVFCIKRDEYMTIAVMVAVGEPTDKIEAGFFGMD